MLARDARSVVDLPPFDRSAMDGYAVRSADTARARCALAGELAAGMTADEPLAPGTALSIMTGAPLPPGADAVLQVEHATWTTAPCARPRRSPHGRHIRYPRRGRPRR